MTHCLSSCWVSTRNFNIGGCFDTLFVCLLLGVSVGWIWLDMLKFYINKVIN